MVLKCDFPRLFNEVLQENYF